MVGTSDINRHRDRFSRTGKLARSQARRKPEPIKAAGDEDFPAFRTSGKAWSLGMKRDIRVMGPEEPIEVRKYLNSIHHFVWG